MAKRPLLRVCYICGREYGSKSIDIHIPQCKIKWQNEEEKKPKHLRKPLPQEPLVDIMQSNVSTEDMSDKQLIKLQNDAAAESFNTYTMEKCQYCGRTFLPDRLIIHHKSCTESNPSRPVGETSGKRNKTTSNNATKVTSNNIATKPRTPIAEKKKPMNTSKELSEENLAGNYSSNRVRRSASFKSKDADEPTDARHETRKSINKNAIQEIEEKLNKLENVAATMIQEIQSTRILLQKLQKDNS